MALNFEISISEKSDGISLKLNGDFDVTSAYELIYAIKKLPENAAKIIVNTNGLKKIYSSGLDVLSGYINSFDGLSARIVLTGNNSKQLSLGNFYSAPKISKFFIKDLSNPNI